MRSWTATTRGRCASSPSTCSRCRPFDGRTWADTVVFFGSARLAKDGPLGRYYDDARELARLLTLWASSLPANCARYVVCSGGGGGIMEAANRGAADAGGRSVGLNIGLPHEQRPNPYVTPELTFEFHYFFMRKLWFAHLARALVVFPGGFGTLDEMTEILTLAQTQKLPRPIPVVLYGSKLLERGHRLRRARPSWDDRGRGPDTLQLRGRSADRIEAAPARNRPDARTRAEEDAGFRAFANTAGRRGLSRGFLILAEGQGDVGF